MVDNHEIIWKGASGTGYKYWIYPINTTFGAGPGNYIFAKETQPNTYAPIYIGQTADLSERFDGHHKMSCIKQKGATHIHVHTSSAKEEERIAEETDLIHKWNPPCNG